jgi:membrane protease YdiL (CAAX protease family)
MNRSATVVVIALAFEGALGLAGWGLAVWQDLPLARRLTASVGEVAVRSAVATLPMLLVLVYVTHSTWRPIAELRRQVEQLVGELFGDMGWPGLAVVSMAAGAGEEILFRGAIQPIAQGWFGATAGLVFASLLFGAAHAITRTYFLFATAVGLYLGWLALTFSELATPIAVHAVYDFVALIMLNRRAATKP